MKFQTDWRVTMAAVAGLGTPDATNSFLSHFSSVVEVFVRLGQLGVAIVTILYIYRKWKAPLKRSPRKK